MSRSFWDWLWDDEYEQETKIYADKDKFVMHTYYNGKKGESRRSMVEADNRTGEITYKDSNPLLEVIGNAVIAFQKRKKLEKE